MGGPKAIPTMCVLTMKKDKLLMPLCTKSRSWFWEIVNVLSGLRAIALPLLFALTASTFWSDLRFNLVVASNKVIAKLPFAKVFFTRKKSRLFDLPPVTQMLRKINIGYFKNTLRFPSASASASH
jgi:hypothetical protein